MKKNKFFAFKIVGFDIQIFFLNSSKSEKHNHSKMLSNLFVLRIQSYKLKKFVLKVYLIDQTKIKQKKQNNQMQNKTA